MRLGYARVSTQDQRLDVQREALTRSGCDKVFCDNMSGKIATVLGSRRRSTSSLKATRWSSRSSIGLGEASSSLSIL